MRKFKLGRRPGRVTRLSMRLWLNCVWKGGSTTWLDTLWHAFSLVVIFISTGKRCVQPRSFWIFCDISYNITSFRGCVCLICTCSIVTGRLTTPTGSGSAVQTFSIRFKLAQPDLSFLMWLYLYDLQQYFRVYSPVVFGKKTDPNGDYIRKWIPQLVNL